MIARYKVVVGIIRWCSLVRHLAGMGGLVGHVMYDECDCFSRMPRGGISLFWHMPATMVVLFYVHHQANPRVVA